MNTVRTIGWVVSSVGALLIGACQSSETRIYTLDSPAPQARIDAYQAPPLRIDALSVPVSWDRIEILSPSALGTLRINDFDHWAAPLGPMARQALSADLDQRLPAGSVTYPRLPQPNPALGISVDILEFTVASAQASMRASWVITPPAGSQSATRGSAVLQETMTSTAPAAVTHAWSELIGQLADRIAAEAAVFR